MVRARLQLWSDSARLLFIRWTYCIRHGHRRKFRVSYCVNCGKEIGWTD
jgi:hypothetical protein